VTAFPARSVPDPRGPRALRRNGVLAVGRALGVSKLGRSMAHPVETETLGCAHLNRLGASTAGHGEDRRKNDVDRVGGNASGTPPTTKNNHQTTTNTHKNNKYPPQPPIPPNHTQPYHNTPTPTPPPPPIGPSPWDCRPAHEMMPRVAFRCRPPKKLERFQNLNACWKRHRQCVR